MYINFGVLGGTGILGFTSLLSFSRCSTPECCGKVECSEDGKPYCIPCLHRIRRLKLIEGAEQVLAPLFLICVDEDQRRKLYRALCTAFHPDVCNGDDSMMKKLNEFKAKLRL